MIGGVGRRDLVAGDLVAAAVDGVEQRLGEVHARAEELHLLAELHRRHAAGDAVVVAPMRPHQVVVLVLQRGRLLADLDAVALEVVRQVLRPEHRDVRLRRRPEIGQRVQHAIAALGHQRPAVQIDAADAFGRPVGVAAEQRVVVRACAGSARCGASAPAGPTAPARRLRPACLPCRSRSM